MPTLTVLSDPLTGERVTHRLRNGETLATALMRLYPGGFPCAWRVYRETVCDANELAAVDLPYHVALEGESYLVVLNVAGPAFAWGTFLENTLISVGLSLVASMLAPKPPRQLQDAPELFSANNQIAAQGNALRPGARVPDILGRVRAYPDLLCPPVDVYNETDQTIGQMFVLGAGAYEVTEKKLGETPLTSVRGSDLKEYLPSLDPDVPTPEVPSFWVLKSSREVGNVSLMGENKDALPIAADTNFFAASHTMHTLEPQAIGVGRPIRIKGTFFNNGVRWVTGIPPGTQTTPPYIYTLDGPVIDETGAEVSITPIPAALALTSNYFYYGNGSPYEFPDEDSDDSEDPQQVQFRHAWTNGDNVPKIGDWVELHITASGQIWRGQIHEAVRVGSQRIPFWGIKINDLYGHPQSFPSLTKKNTIYSSYREEAFDGGEDEEPPPEGLTNAPTNWYAAPMDDPEEIWIDIAFPQGLAFYDRGARRPLYVQVLAEFRRAGAPDDPPQASVMFEFSYGTAAPLRFTKPVPVSSLTTLPTGAPTIEVRLTRITPYYADSTNNQYIQETRWVRLGAVRRMTGQVYKTATILAFSMSNTNSAGAVGDMALNVVATRILPSWTPGGGWSTPAPSRRWADNFVARAKAHDGAFRTDEQLDLEGIYQLQEHLEEMDAGKVGEISMTLDAMQDIDAELASIADVVRAVLYRVGRKLFVTRDQESATRIALFNARAKSPDGETVTVRMTGDADNDCVVVKWVDEFSAWKQREYQYPPDVVPQNPLRIAARLANWPQAYRRAVYEWNRIQYRREGLTCDVSEDGRIVRVGDVVNVSDDVANLATCAGELVRVEGGVLTLDRDVTPIESGDTFSILLRDLDGVRVDTVPCTPVPGTADRVQLTRTTTVELKGRDAARGNLYALYRNGAATVRPWLVISTAAGGPYVKLATVNYTNKVYTGDTAPLPLRPILDFIP